MSAESVGEVPTAAPAVCAVSVAEFESLATVVAGIDVATVPDVPAHLRAVLRLERVLTGYRLALAARAEAEEHWKDTSSPSAADWYGKQTGQSTGAAEVELSTADIVTRPGPIGAATRAGMLSDDQVREVASVADVAGEQELDGLVHTALHESFQQLRQEAERVRSRLSTAEHERRAWKARRVTVHPTPDHEMSLRAVGPLGDLPRVNGVLDAKCEELFAADRRSGRRRSMGNIRFDAFIALMGLPPSPEPPEAPSGGGFPPAGPRRSGPAGCRPGDPRPAGSGPGGSRAGGSGPDGSRAGGSGPDGSRPGGSGPGGPGGCDSRPREPKPPSSEELDFGPLPSRPAPSGPRDRSPRRGPDRGAGPDDPAPPVPLTLPLPLPKAGSPPNPEENAGSKQVDDSEPARPTDEVSPADRMEASRVKGTLRVDHSALSRGWLETGDVCDLNGRQALSLAALRSAAPGSKLIAVVTTADDVLVGVASFGSRFSRRAGDVDWVAGDGPRAPGRQVVPRSGLQLIVRVRESELARTGHEEGLQGGEAPFLTEVARRLVPAADLVTESRGCNALQNAVLDWMQPMCSVAGCNHSATENDHRIEWVRCRLTDLANIDRLCPFHHRQKTHHGFHLVPGVGRRAFVRDDPAVNRNATPGPPRSPQSKGRAGRGTGHSKSAPPLGAARRSHAARRARPPPKH